jgi:predicted alpha-1,2-mannosidase
MLLVMLLGAGACTANRSQQEPEELPAPDLARHVDPFIGTGGHGHTYPGATVPFGMVQLSPDTRLTGWDSCSGYHYSDDKIHGFSHTHLSGTGVPDYCDVLLMPQVAPHVDPARPIDRFQRGPSPEANKAPPQRFDKKTERASPGYYRVVLDDDQDNSGDEVEVELTATPRVGMHRYRFPPDRYGYVYLDLVHRDPVTKATMTVGHDRRFVSGERRSRAWARDQRVFFALEFSRPALSCQIPQDDGMTMGAFHFDDTALRVRYLFAPSSEPLLVRMGLSATGVAEAEKNLRHELTHWDFDRVRREARDTWNRALSKVQVEGGTERQRRIFYLFSDVDGRYRGLDGKVHDSRGHDIYTVFSLWDTFRAAHPLYTILQQERTKDFLGTFLAHYEESGRLPVWELAGNETNCMIGYHAVPVIVDAYVKGIRGHDDTYMPRLYEACKHFAMLDQRGQDAYKQLGFIPSEHEGESVSKTLEYAYDDWCIARMAAGLGRDEDKTRFLRRAQAYKNLFDPETGFLRPKRNHIWKTPFDPREVDFNFTEANCWQYTFFVPHDVAGLIELLGGKEAFASKLDELFEAPQQTTGRRQSDITGLIGQYAHGNEPSHHMAYLYNHAGQPWKTQRRVRQILGDLYDDAPDGLCGNEDCGQMSAWYVLSALGFYPVCPGTDRYEIGSPLFPKATLQLRNGKRFVIRANGVSKDNIYIRAAWLNGKPWTKGWISHQALMAGGELRFEMGPEPQRHWATQPADLPCTSIDSDAILPVPFVVARGRTFRKSIQVELRTITEDTKIHYTVDDREPTRSSPVYASPIELTGTTTLKAFASKADMGTTPVITARFHQIPNDWTITLRHRYSRQYTAGGDHALIDGLRGTKSWRTGSWQGYHRNFEATVDLGKIQRLTRVGAGFLQDVGSWIWMPKAVEFAVSIDGSTYTRVGKLAAKVSDRSDAVTIQDHEQKLDRVEARYVRVKAKNYGRIPDWHPGKGGRAWIFVDEVLIEAIE